MKEWVGMTKKSFDIYETAALADGGTAAGQYLDSINQTDLAELDQNQFTLFFAKFLGGYEDSMKKAMEALASE
jgi:hypothetical protein